MPSLCIKHIISFSSENEKHRTENLLSLNPNKTWRCEKPGEKCAYVLLQLEKASSITGVDIGNDHSAFVEVLVSRTGGTNDTFEELLPMSSLMTPEESRNSTFTNRVRMFTTDKFTSEVQSKKWDQIKIVCTQPFNTHVNYGLAFVKINGKDEAPLNNSSHTPSTFIKNDTSNKVIIGRFKFREDSPDEAILGTGSLFARRKELSQEDKTKLKLAAAIREASLLNSNKSKQKNTLNDSKSKGHGATLQEKIETLKLNRNREALLYNEEDDCSNERLNKLLERDQNAKLMEKERLAKEAQKMKLAKEAEKSKLSRESQSTSFEPKKAKKNESQSYDSSPIDNKRFKKNENHTMATNNSSTKKTNTIIGPSTSKGELENKPMKTSAHSSKALKNDGAIKQKKYKPFNKLFENVVFVLSGFENPLRSNLRTRALEMGATYQPNWNDRCTHLICAFANTPKYQQVRGKGKIVKKNWIEDCHSQQKYIPWRRFSLVPTDLKMNESDEEIFSEETCENVRMDNITLTKPKTIQNLTDDKNAKCDPFEMSTEIEDETEKSKDFFNGKTFYIDESVGSVASMKLNTIINLLGGTVDKVLTSDIDYNITDNKIYDFGEVLQVKPEWIYECNDMEMFLPINRYIL